MKQATQERASDYERMRYKGPDDDAEVLHLQSGKFVSRSELVKKTELFKEHLQSKLSKSRIK